MVVPAVAVHVVLLDEAPGAVYLGYVPEVLPEDEEGGDPARVGGEGDCGQEKEDVEVIGRAQ